MIKSHVLALLTAVALTTVAAMAEGDACPFKSVACGDKAKAECDLAAANLDLTKEQETKLKALQDECAKEGCTKDSLAKMRGIL